MNKIFKGWSMALFSFIAIMMLACQNSFDGMLEEDVLNGETSQLQSRSIENVDEKGFYPLGVIPQWVKDSLSEENLEILKKLSSRYKMKYYRLTEEERQDPNRKIESEYIVKALLSENLMKASFKPVIDSGWVKKAPLVPITSPRLRSFSEVDFFEVAKITHTLRRLDYVIGYISLKAFLSCQINRVSEEIREPSCEINIVTQGLKYFSQSWQDGGTTVFAEKGLVKYRVIGTYEVSFEIGGIGTTSSDEVDEEGSWDPFND